MLTWSKSDRWRLAVRSAPSVKEASKLLEGIGAVLKVETEAGGV